MHRDFSSNYIARMVIEKDRIEISNANRPHGHGNLDLKKFSPFQKNPAISQVFREIGLADELGSGMRNSYKFTKLYSGGEPTFTEDGDLFRIIIPLSVAATVSAGATEEKKQTIAENGTVTETGGECNQLVWKCDERGNSPRLALAIKKSRLGSEGTITHYA